MEYRPIPAPETAPVSICMMKKEMAVVFLAAFIVVA